MAAFLSSTIKSPPATSAPLRRRLRLWPVTTINILSMVGVGPFITIPLLLQAMPGPQAMIGWILGAVIALADGLVWAELGAAFPRSGGGYQYVLEAYGPQGPGRLMSFLYLWTTVITGPFAMASGAIGFAQYTSYLIPKMTPWEGKGLAIAVCLVAASLIYRRIDRIGRWAQFLGVVVVLTVFWIIIEGVRHGQVHNLTLPAHALTSSPALWTGLGGATLFALYDYFGYSTVCSVASEVVRPERTIPRSIILAIGIVAALYISMNLAVLSALPWCEAAQSKFVASDLIARLDGPLAGAVMTCLILTVTISGLFAGMLSCSRVPYAAAVDGRFFRAFARVHPTRDFPTFSVGFVGIASGACCLLELDQVIRALSVAAVILSSLTVVAAPTMLRLTRPDVRRPFRMWLYPLPSLIAAAGWSYIVVTSGPPYILGGLGALALGVLGYLWLARKGGEWPWTVSIR